MFNRANQLKRLTVRYYGALHAAVAVCSADQVAEAARELGDQAVELGMNKRELEWIHAQALWELTPSCADQGVIERIEMRAGSFLSATVAAIEFRNANQPSAGKGLLKAAFILMQPN